LWALQFGNAGQNGTPDMLFFTAGPDDESHGLFGTITPG
jgi:LmbE family N-acetylglucosaminyl deacetylase